MSVPMNNGNRNAGNASLYVGDLDPDIAEALIYDKFSTVGQILSIRVCRDMISRKSLGYAYVNFASPADAERAIDTLNFDVLKNKQMRIMWSQRDPCLRISGVGNLFVKNLDKSITTRELYDTFSLFGEILSCKITTDEKGNSKGYGFVHFSFKESADKAIASLNEKLLKEKKVFVGNFMARKQRGKGGSGESLYNNLFIKNFGEDMTETRLKELFSKYGDITSVKVEEDSDKPKGFGFVCYKNPESATAAVNEMNGTEVNGKTVYVGRAMKKNERTEFLKHQFERKKNERGTKYAQGVNLYVKNLDDSIDDDALKGEFSDFGTITSVRVMRDESKRSKGFGFVCFSSPEEATKAVTEMNGKLVSGKPLYVALAQRKEERRIHLANQIMQRQFALRQTQPTLPPTPMIPQQMIAASFGNANNFFPPMTHRPNMFPGQPGSHHAMPYGPQRNVAPRWANPQHMNPHPGMRPNQPQNAMTQGYAAPMMRNNMIPPSAPSQMAPQQAGQMPRPQMQGTPTGGQRPNVQFTANARNINHPGNMQNRGAPMMNNMPQPAAVNPAQQAVANPSSQPQQQATVPLEENAASKDFINTVNALPNGEKKQMLGERLYTTISAWYPEQAGKLTGMLLELDNRELLSLILEADNKATNETCGLKVRVDAALEVLKTSAPPAKEAGKTNE